MPRFADRSPIAIVRRPAVVLAIALAGCATLMFLPERWRSPVKGFAADCLRPGQQVVRQARAAGSRGATLVRSYFQAGSDTARLASELARITEENRRLAAEVAALRVRAASATTEPSGGGLLRARLLEARVLGRQALAWLGRAEMLDVGRTAGAETGTLVLDCGQDRNLKSGQLVVGEDCVWGRIAEAGRYTSLVHGPLDVAYRDVVQIVGQKAAARGLRRGPQGLLEGIGGPQAKISRVQVTEPIEVGDLVYTASESGLLVRPALYGRVVRLERPVGSACWEIWMEPAVGSRMPDRLLVVTAELNPARLAAPPARPQEAKR